MGEISMIGLDIAKNVFQVHGIDVSGAVVLRRQLRRAQVEKFFAQLAPTKVGMEACGSAHHWARVVGRYGHEVRLMPPAYVKAYVKRNKNDGRDAEGICEAMGRPTMRFVAVKSVEQQAVLAVHSTRALLVRQRTMVANDERATNLIFRTLHNTARVAKNAISDEVIAIEKRGSVTFADIKDLVAGTRGAAVLDKGDMDAGIWSAGQSQALIHDIPTCAELVSRIMREAEALIRERLAAMIGP